MVKTSFLLVLLATFAPSWSEARVVRFVVEQKRPLADGMSFGTAGAYERLDGTAYFEVDPKDPLNAVIVNLDRAPRNARGFVEFSSSFVILKPVDVAKGNHKIFYAINNRGNQQAISYFNFGRGGNNPLTVADVGDGFLMRLGYTIVDAGWEGDLVAGGGRLVPRFPVARQPDGSSIVAKVRIEYSDRTIPDKGTFTLPLEGAANFKAYPAADTSMAHATLTVRDSVSGAKTTVPADRWAFGTSPTGKASLAANDTNICLFDGFRADRLYELIYQAKDPIVMGLAYAVTRDIGSFLRYETKDAAGNPNPLSGITRIYSFGGSQSGEYQREFSHTGWNVRKKESRGPNLCALDGSFIPFAVTKEQRTSTGDPRKSLQKRYVNHAGYVNEVRKQAKALVGEGFLLEEDAERLIKQAEDSGILLIASPSAR